MLCAGWTSYLSTTVWILIGLSTKFEEEVGFIMCIKIIGTITHILLIVHLKMFWAIEEEGSLNRRSFS